MKRLLSILCLLIGCYTIYAGPTKSEDAAKAALAKIDEQIAYEQRTGNIEKEGQAAIFLYLSLSRTLIMNEYGSMLPSLSIEKIWADIPETSVTPLSFFVTGCCLL